MKERKKKSVVDSNEMKESDRWNGQGVWRVLYNVTLPNDLVRIVL